MDFCSGRLSSVRFANILVKEDADVMCRCNISSELPSTRGYIRTKLSSSSSQLCVRYSATDTNCFDATSFRDVPVGMAPSGSTEIYLKTNTSLPNGVLTVYGFGESITHLSQLTGSKTVHGEGTMAIHWRNDF